MSYLNLLEFKQEPFSNSPDPEFFYESPQHLECLHKLEISIRLMRGLNVVLGEVGAGKSTLCRLLLRNLNRDQKVRSHLLLDPQFSSPKAMLEVLHSLFLGEESPAGLTEWQLKEAVKNQLFKLGVDEGRLVVLIIDEGQKISHACLEVLRELLNYETNNTKLLQIVLFAQTEFAELIRQHPNVADRINEYTVLGPLTFRQTRAMIRHRMTKAGKNLQQKDRFTLLGYLAVYRLSGGHPRKIIRLCHKAMLGCILRNTKKAGWRLVHTCNKDVVSLAGTRKYRAAYAMSAAGFLLAAGLAVGSFLSDGPAAAPVEGPGAGAQKNLTAPVEEPSAHSQAGGLAKHGDEIRNPVVFPVVQEPPLLVPVVEEDSQAASKPVPAKPQSLGAYTVTRSISTEALLQLVYGEADEAQRAKLLALNPALPREGLLRTGTALQLPVPAERDLAGLAPSFVVQITQDESLQMMVDVLQGLRDQGLDVAMAPQPLDDGRQQFAIVQDSSFQTEQAAVHALRSLPPLFQSGAKVVRGMQYAGQRNGEVTLASFRQETASTGGVAPLAPGQEATP